MAEVTAPINPKGIHWSSAVIAGLLATVAITITMALFGMNIMKMLGSTMLGEGASVGVQYTVGGLVHLMIGLVYGIIFAWLFAPVNGWNSLLKGIVYGLAITAIALATMPVLMAMMGGDGAANPCAAANAAAAGNPCAPGASNPCAPTATNPCVPDASNPCASPAAAENPCAPEAKNPCGPAAGAKNPCNPCNPCAPKTAGNACRSAAGNPCNPCGGGGGPFDAMISLINHLVYGIVLVFAYRPRSV